MKKNRKKPVKGKFTGKKSKKTKVLTTMKEVLEWLILIRKVIEELLNMIDGN